MIEVVYNGRMALRDSFVWRFIIYKPAVVFLCDLFCFLFERFKIAPVFLVVDLVIQRYQIRVLLCNIVHNGLLEAAAQIQILQLYQVALILRPLNDRLDVCNAGEYRGNEADSTDPCVIDLLHSRKPAFNARGGIHIILERFVQCIN